MTKNKARGYKILSKSSKRVRLEVPFLCTPAVQTYLSHLSREFEVIDHLQFYLNEYRLTLHLKEPDEKLLDQWIGAIKLEDLSRLYQNKEEFLAISPGKIVARQCLKRSVYLTLVPSPLRLCVTLTKLGLYARQAFYSLACGHLTMELLDFTAVLAAVSMGDPDGAGTIMFILELGERMDAWTLDKSIHDLTDSLSQKQVLIWVEDEKGERRQLASDFIQKGDHIVVQEGGEIYFDGFVVKGQGAVQESNLTGEPFPVSKTIGDSVTSNTTLEYGDLVVEVTNPNFNAHLKELVAAIHESSKSQSQKEVRLTQKADTLVKYNYLGMALTYLLTGSVQKALSFLLVDFSCALKLSTSVAYLTAIREAMDKGIVVKGSRYIDQYPQIDCLIFDKTGTLTTSKLVISQVVPFGGHTYEEVLKIGACLEEHLYHPIANAVVMKAADEGIVHEEMHGPLFHIASRGIRSSIGEDEVLIGSYQFIEEEKVRLTEEQQELIRAYRGKYNLLFLARAKELIAIFCVDTPLRANVVEVLKRLKDEGKEIALLTGDVEDRTLDLREKVAFDEVKCQVTPEDKLNFIKERQAKGQEVLMIGDGLNDSAAIAQADLGIVMADSSDLARQTSDMIFLSDDLQSLFDLEDIYHRLQKQLDWNLFRAVGINSSLILMGLAGVLPTSFLATFHNLTTMLLVADSFKLKESKKEIRQQGLRKEKSLSRPSEK
ncbi:heavy metal translocating P-type ATPase [Atopobacter sp. AH10]|uniref:heavy metal translocating P-type ATPase n=1 Tax=Atopobacter sp. AH10 TaxID=2315861 RepID=UPI000EF1D8B8|nr:heavy metal translocating P-type ATPase [Atopobacter sp. AH10]RLK63086.1 heavy metal translocating P-type ATPase [Atopobacter sp. AH10]